MALRLVRGFNQLVGEPGSGKTILALLLGREYEAPAILVTQPLARLAFLAPADRVLAIRSLTVAFQLMQRIQEEEAADVIVLDDLASLLPDHPAARIATSLSSALEGRQWDLPILVVNQYRHPQPPGGTLFRSLVKRQISLHRIRPGMRDLVSAIFVDRQRIPELLFWPWTEEAPEIRCPTSMERILYGLDLVPTIAIPADVSNSLERRYSSNSSHGRDCTLTK